MRNTILIFLLLLVFNVSAQNKIIKIHLKSGYTALFSANLVDSVTYGQALSVHQNGNISSFDTTSIDRVSYANDDNVLIDFDGNVYQTVMINNREWMADNLRVSTYRNGTSITNLTDTTQWRLTGSNGAWCFHNFNATNNFPYGKLYNWYAVKNAANLCPAGWQIPSKNEVENLFSSLGYRIGTYFIVDGVPVPPGNISPDTKFKLSNAAGFSVFPAGSLSRPNISSSFQFSNLNQTGIWWTSTQSNNDSANYYFDNGFVSFLNKFDGLPVRCIKSLQAASVTTLNCSGATNNGTLIRSTAATNVSSSISYTGGNGGSYESQIINSTGVTGLTATLNEGVLATGSGNISLTITGTPASAGTASFLLNIGGQTCTLNRTVTLPVADFDYGFVNNVFTHNGILTSGTSATDVTSVLPYKNGNGGAYDAQSVASTGVTGLTCSIASGTVANGNGSFTFTITGTPSSAGAAFFNITIGANTLRVSRTVFSSSGSSTGITSHTCGASDVHNSSLPYGTMTDQQGNSYRTVQIGTQNWMAENLRTTIYRDGTAIPNITDSTQWQNNTEGAYCFYDNNSSNDCPYGKLYNWYAYTNAKQLCPVGWHTPTTDEWSSLSVFLADSSNNFYFTSSSMMRSTGSQYWNNDRLANYEPLSLRVLTNSSGFSALPGASRNGSGVFANLRYSAFWWGRSQNSSGFLQDSGAEINNSGLNSVDILNVSGAYNKSSGLSVRCVKD